MADDVQVTFDKTIEINGREVLFRLTYQTEASPGEVEDIVAKHAHRLIGEKYDSKGVGYTFQSAGVDLRAVRAERQARRAHYNESMTSADGLYGAEVKALRSNKGFDASVTQTGGMCLAIQIPVGSDSEGYVLITDSDGPLPWNRSEQEGWWAIYYASAESEGDQVIFNEKFSEGDGTTTARMIATVREFVGKYCQRCGVAYAPTKKMQRYCSAVCKAESDKASASATMKRYYGKKKKKEVA